MLLWIVHNIQQNDTRCTTPLNTTYEELVSVQQTILIPCLIPM